MSQNYFKLLVLHSYKKGILVEYVPNDTLIAVKIAYRWP